MTSAVLNNIVAAQKQGRARGIASICSANPTVLNAAFAHAEENDLPLLIESTCNQVNQFGGYTGQTPAEFMANLQRLAGKHHFPPDKLIVGGDHLGPNPWRDEPAALAMSKARVLVRDYVRAGYTKIHLDASMRCSDDPMGPLATDIIANRSANLALAAEEAMHELGETAVPLQYVIGTEVPAPGGVEEEDELHVTSVESVEETIRATHEAFLRRGLEDAWPRVIAVVVQPGVEYGNESLIPYDAQAAAHLARFIAAQDRLVFEAHSTDYQTQEALRQLVKDQFAILKVGPALTFAYREAIFALAMIEEAWLTGRREYVLSNIRNVIEQEMLAKPVYWQAYYPGDERQQRFARQYSLSDRLRYYWPVDAVQRAQTQLLANLSHEPIPLPLISQFMPLQYRAVREGELANEPMELAAFGVTAVLDGYAWACSLLR